MKHQYVITSNHNRLMSGIQAVENRGSQNKNIVLLTGEPSAGKTYSIDNWGSDANALALEGLPTMNLTYVTDWLADQTGVHEKRKFNQQKAVESWFKETGFPIVFDEAQHGLKDKAACIEYLRRLTELSGTYLVLVCHTSERHNFAANKVAHIASRISNIIELKRANHADCALYLGEKCEVKVDDTIVATALQQSSGGYRLLDDAVKTLEAIGAKLGKKELMGADIGKIKLCENAMQTLARGGK